jgi:hypothetical protein
MSLGYHEVSGIEGFKAQVVWRIGSHRKRWCRAVAEGQERESRGEREREREREEEKRKRGKKG